MNVSISPRGPHILFSTQRPAAVQTIPWPHVEAAALQSDSDRTWLGHDTTLVGHRDLPWLIRTDGMFSVVLQNVNPY